MEVWENVRGEGGEKGIRPSQRDSVLKCCRFLVFFGPSLDRSENKKAHMRQVWDKQSKSTTISNPKSSVCKCLLHIGSKRNSKSKLCTDLLTNLIGYYRLQNGELISNYFCIFLMNSFNIFTNTHTNTPPLPLHIPAQLSGNTSLRNKTANSFVSHGPMYHRLEMCSCKRISSHGVYS